MAGAGPRFWWLKSSRTFVSSDCGMQLVNSNSSQERAVANQALVFVDNVTTDKHRASVLLYIKAVATMPATAANIAAQDAQPKNFRVPRMANCSITA